MRFPTSSPTLGRLLAASALTASCAVLSPLAARADGAAAPGSVPAAVPPPAPDRAGYVYSYALDDVRYDDAILSIDAYKPLGSPAAAIRPYAAFAITRDSRTTGGDVPQIYSDNYLLGALGLQLTNERNGLRLFVQGGVTAPIGQGVSVPSGGDLRLGVQRYREWGGPLAGGPLYGNLYSSATYFSRYGDAIVYNQLELGRTHGIGAHAVDAFVRITATLDTRSFYYSNLAELTAGIRFHPFGAHGPTLSLEQVAGAYLRNAPRPLGTGPIFADFRPTLTYGTNI